MEEKIKIQDESGDKKYFTIIPNYIFNHSTIWDREVYCQMKRIAGENGTCWTSRNTLAKQCGISLARLKKSIKYLIEHQWIEFVGEKKISTNGGSQGVNEYRIIDLWDKNNAFYQNKYKGGSSETPPLNKGGLRNDQRGVVDDTKGGFSGNPKEEPNTNKNHINKNQSYLLNIPLEDLVEFKKKITATDEQIKNKAEDLLLYCQSKGRIYKNYKAFLLGALKRDFPIKSEEVSKYDKYEKN